MRATARIQPPTDAIAIGTDIGVLDRARLAPVACAVWRRTPPLGVTAAARALTGGEALDVHALGDGTGIADSLAVVLMQRAPRADLEPLLADIAALVDRFRRVMRLDAAMAQIETVEGDGCRFFHADRVYGRLLCTYVGPGTVIAPDAIVDRGALGQGDNAGVLRGGAEDLIQLEQGDVGIFMGDLAHGESGRGVVHRSPVIGDSGIVRLVLRIDFPGACNCGAAHPQFRFRAK